MCQLDAAIATTPEFSEPSVKLQKLGGDEIKNSHFRNRDRQRQQNWLNRPNQYNVMQNHLVKIWFLLFSLRMIDFNYV